MRRARYTAVRGRREASSENLGGKTVVSEHSDSADGAGLDARPDAFPSTRWSRLLTGSSADAEAKAAAFETLAHRYWRPVAAFVRARGAPSDEDAHDATQDFFLWMLESGFLQRADPERGRFRGFIKRSLTNFLHDEERRRRTVKRGGANRTFSLPEHDEGGWDLPEAGGRAPEHVLDDLWRQELLAQATESLERELTEKGKMTAFRIFQDYYLSDEELDYEALAQRHGVSRVDVSNRLAYAKKRYRACLRAAVIETVGTAEDLESELAWLFEGRA